MNSDTAALRLADDIGRLTLQWGELLRRVLADNVDTANVRRGLQHLIVGKPVGTCQPPQYFAPLAQQIANIEAWNKEYGWGFSDELIARRCLEARTFDWPGDRLQAIVLVPSLETPAATLLGLLKIMDNRRVGCLNAWPSTLLGRAEEDPSIVSLMDGIEFRPNSLEWRLVDLGSHLYKHELRGKDTRRKAAEYVTPATAAHAEAVAAAAHFPGWLKAMYAHEVPSVMLPGYRLIGPDPYDRSDTTYYLSISYSSGDTATTLHGYSFDTMFDGNAIATVGPVELGTNI